MTLNFSSGDDHQTLADNLDAMINGSFAELQHEIPRMVDASEEVAALALYGSMHEKLEEFKRELVSTSPNP